MLGEEKTWPGPVRLGPSNAVDLPQRPCNRFGAAHAQATGEGGRLTDDDFVIYDYNHMSWKSQRICSAAR